MFLEPREGHVQRRRRRPPAHPCNPGIHRLTYAGAIEQLATVTDIAARRLRAQRLTGEPFKTAIDAVRWLGAVQAQDYSGAKWAVGQRTEEATETVLDRLFDQGSLLRTHVMRPTWHLVVPEDIRWMLELTGPRIRQGMAARDRQLEIDDRVVERACEVFAAALVGGHHLTRQELGEILRIKDIAPQGQRLPHLLMNAELSGLITSGPRHGKQFTYALLEERAPRAPGKERAEAVAELARRYFESHGPAQVQDFGWWSGLTVADARVGIAVAGSALDRQVLGGKEYWFGVEGGPQGGQSRQESPVAHLLPNYDEYTVAYRDRTAALDPDRHFEPSLYSFGSMISNVITVDGRVRGAWRRTVLHGTVEVELRLAGPLMPVEAAAVEDAGRRLGRFLDSRVVFA